MLGSSESKNSRLISYEIIFKIFRPMWPQYLKAEVLWSHRSEYCTMTHPVSICSYLLETRCRDDVGNNDADADYILAESEVSSCKNTSENIVKNSQMITLTFSIMCVNISWETLTSSSLNSLFLSGPHQINSRLPDGSCHVYKAKEPGSRLRHCSFTSLHTGTPSVTEPKNPAQDSGTVPLHPCTQEHQVLQSQRTGLKTPAMFLYIPAHRNTKCYRAKEQGSRLRQCSFTSLHTGTPSVTEPKNRAQDSGTVPLHPCTQEHQVLQSQRTGLKTPALFLHVHTHMNTECYRAKEPGSSLRHWSITWTPTSLMSDNYSTVYHRYLLPVTLVTLPMDRRTLSSSPTRLPRRSNGISIVRVTRHWKVHFN